VSRNRVGVSFAALAACSVLIALAVTLWQAAALRTQRDAAQAARARSDIDRDRARAVADFMRSTFEQADPGKASEGGLLARDLIERGKRRLATLDGQPDVQAELALLLAESNAGMGLVQESDALYRQHAAAIETLSATDPKIRWRAGLLRLSNRIVLDKDGPQLDAALSALQRRADTPQMHVQLVRQQERLLARRSEFGLAARTLEDAWRRYSGALDEPSKLQLQTDLGYALLNANRNADARRVCERIDRAALRHQDPALQIRALRLLARELDARGSDRDALIRTINDWQRTAEQLYGSDSLEAASAYLWTVGISTDQQEQDTLMNKAYAIQSAKLPAASIARAYAEYNMAGFYLELRQRPDLALPHLARAARIGRDVSSRAHADVRTFELTWAETLNRLGRYRECLDRLSAPPGQPEDDDDAQTLSKLRLELAKAAAALHRPRDVLEEIAAVTALWRGIGKPLPAVLSATMSALEASLGPRADER
jgi:hypothetical protein